jgi:hypothetical protein
MRSADKPSAAAGVGAVGNGAGVGVGYEITDIVWHIGNKI